MSTSMDEDTPVDYGGNENEETGFDEETSTSEETKTDSQATKEALANSDTSKDEV